MHTAQWFSTARNVADINNRQATEAIPVSLIPIDSLSYANLAVKKHFWPEGRGFGAKSGQSKTSINPILGVGLEKLSQVFILSPNGWGC